MIKLAAYFQGYASKVDGSASLRFTTQELAPDDFAEFAKNLNGLGWLLFVPQDTKEIEIPKERIEDDRKSPSERLYSVLYVYWKQQKVEEPFDVWRIKQMEKFITAIKAKLKDE